MTLRDRTIRHHVTPECLRCHKSSVIELDKEKFAEWIGGKFVQDVWPDWTPQQREMLLTGTHEQCWNDLFGGEEDDEGDDGDEPM